MARILFTSQPLAGHLRPGLAVARALAAAGHEVAWYTGRKYRTLVSATGARFVPYPERLDWDDATLAQDGAERRGLRALEHDLITVFVAPIADHVAALESVIASARPDVIVAEQGFVAGPAAGEVHGIPSVTYTVTPLTLSSVDTAPFGTGLAPATSPLGRARNRLLGWAIRHLMFARAQRAAVDARRTLGLPRLPGYFMDWGVAMSSRYLHTSIPELEYPRRDLPAKVEFVGALLPSGVDDWSPPAWWPELDAARREGRPVILLTQGTVAMNLNDLLLPSISALAGEDALVVATTVERDPADVMPVHERPANLRLERFIPFTELLPMVDVMVTNGGFGGVQTALAHGVPIVAAGTTEDKAEVNARLAWAGAGISLRTDHPNQDQIRTAVRRLLDEPRYTEQARRLQRAYARYNGVERTAQVILEAAGQTTTTVSGRLAGA